MNIPVIDVSPLFTNNKEAKKRVAHAIDQACQESGFFYVKGHSISSERMEEMYALMKTFFDLPAEEKLNINIKKSANHRGYGEPKSEQLDPKNPNDFKESFDMGLNLPKTHPLVTPQRPLYGPNQYPVAALPEFQKKMEQHYWDMLALGKTLLSAIAIALDIDEDFFADKFNNPLSVLRFLHYPQTPVSDTKPIGAGAHTDYGCITILWQDEVGGLQVQDTQGQWIDAPPIANTFVINIGNMMARWSNDRYKSTAHRVYSPSQQERYSIPFFVEPDFDTDIRCLPNCCPSHAQPKYEPISAGDWMIYCFDHTYAYRRVENT